MTAAAVCPSSRRGGRRGRAVVVLVVAAALLVVGAGTAVADPAKPSNYRSSIVEQPAGVTASVQGGDSFLVVDVPAGTQLVVPGYADGEVSTAEEVAALEQYLRVLPDGTVQLNERSAAFYQNAARYGAAPEGPVGPDVPPDWQTVAADGRVAWHDHRIHWMSPVPPDRIDRAGPAQDVQDYTVPVLVDGQLVTAVGDLDWVPDPSPVGVLVAALVGLVGAAVLTRRARWLGAAATLVTGGTITAVLVAASVGRAVGFEVATPPVALAAVGALAPLLGTVVPGVRAPQRTGLVVIGGVALLLFGVLATGLLDPLFGGGGTGEGGFGNWWLRPTLPVDVAPGMLRLAIAAGTGAAAGLLAAVTADHLAIDGGLDGGPDEGVDGVVGGPVADDAASDRPDGDAHAG